MPGREPPSPNSTVIRSPWATVYALVSTHPGATSTPAPATSPSPRRTRTAQAGAPQEYPPPNPPPASIGAHSTR